MFENYSPRTLRAAVEHELQSNDDIKLATKIAMKRLDDDPEYYEKNFGIMEKAKRMPIGAVSKGRKKIAEGKWVIVKEESDSDKIKLRMRFDSNDLFSNFSLIGFEERFGDEKTSKKALDAVENFEDNIPEDNNEHVAVIDNSGNILFTKTGNYDEIEFDENEIKKIRSSEILTHNHPEDKSFSAEDVFLALSLGIKELRVKTPENTYYFKISRKMKPENKKEISSDNRTFIIILSSINSQVYDIFRKEVQEGKITPGEAEKEHREMLWEMIAESSVLSKYFYIEYGKVIK